MLDLYEHLGVPNEATSDQIRSAIETARLILSDEGDTRDQAERQREMSSLTLAEGVLLDEHKRRDYDKALQYAADSSVVQRDVDVGALVQEAWSLVSTNAGVAQAIAIATRATQIEPDNVRALGALAYSYQKWGQLDEALRVIKRALRLSSLDSAAHGVLASIYKDMERYSEAIQSFEKGFSLDPGMSEAFGFDYCACLWSARLHEKAVAFLESARQRDPSKKDYANALATSYCLLIPQKWTQVGNENEVGAPTGSYITTRAHAEISIALLEKARQLDVSDESAKAHMKEIAEAILFAVSRRMHGSAIGAIAGGIIWSFVYGLGLILAPAYFFAARSPGYLVNRDQLAGTVTADQEASAQSGMDKLFAYAVNGAILPVLVVRAYLKNYTGEQKDLEPLVQRARALCTDKP
jgi:tetratricopeptide (TPR) repeat protein